MLVHITAVNYKGPEKNQWGKDSWKVGIQTAEYGDKWINGFLPFPPDRWKDSQQELEIYEKEKNGTVYTNFKLPPKEPRHMPTTDNTVALSVINTKLDQIIAHLSNTKRLDTTSDGKQVPFAEEDNW